MRAYLTVISWPDSVDEEGRIDALVNCAGIDLYQARLGSRRNTPGIMCILNAAMRERALGAIHQQGIMAIAPTRAEIEDYPRAQVARGVDQFPDTDPPAFCVDDPKGGAWTFNADRVRLAVYGHVSATSKSYETDERAVGGMLSIENAAMNAAAGNLVRTDQTTRLIEVLDLHISTSRGVRLVRLIGPRARIGILGDEYQRPSLLNDAKATELVQLLMPGAEVDRGFRDFDPPGDLRARVRADQRN